ncbi:hypothetical protein Pcinc_035990, partial [Petrolisthes cinctipes]
WDEVHFGTFANHYINRTFFHDVHPPLGKMIIAGTAWATGYNGSFDFQQGTRYNSNINYTALRSVMSLFGGSLVPLSFLVVWELTFCLPASAMAALCVLCDTFVHRLNTLILLDPPLLASMLSALYGSLKVHNHSHRAWSVAWWGWLAWTGLSLGTVVSIKYVGVFTFFTVGLHTAYQLYCILTHPTKPIWHVIPHTLARVLVLILLPLAVYLTSFLIHFSVLTNWAVNGGGFYHTKFVASFSNTEFDNVTIPEFVHYGANLTIQSSRPLCGYLESWFDLFPSAWTRPMPTDESQPPQLVRSGDHIMLTHVATGRSLRSHGHRAPITRRHYQVCGYGDEGEGGPMETWLLEVMGEEENAPLSVINQDFRLKHYKMSCYLKANEKVVLPKQWAFNGAKEVTCTRNMKEHVDPRSRAAGLWGKIVQQHLNMFIGNSVLVPNTDEMERSARPWMWPTLYQIQTMGSYIMNETSGEEHYSIGMTNPFITYLNLVTLLATPLLTFVHFFSLKRGVKQPRSHVERRAAAVWWCWGLAVCWAVHYLPFFFMSRVLYYHHYCPAYIFSCMITGVMLWWMSESVAGVVRRWRWRWSWGRGWKGSWENEPHETREKMKGKCKVGESAREAGNKRLENQGTVQDNKCFLKRPDGEKEDEGKHRENVNIKDDNKLNDEEVTKVKYISTEDGGEKNTKKEKKESVSSIREEIGDEGEMEIEGKVQKEKKIEMERKVQEEEKTEIDEKRVQEEEKKTEIETKVREEEETEIERRVQEEEKELKEAEDEDHLPFLLLLLPASLVLASYVFFFPLATYIKGQHFETHPVLCMGLNIFHWGQMWPEFGYRKDEFLIVSSTKIGTMSPDFLDNPDINATLFFASDLSNSPSPPHLISPAPASNYTRERREEASGGGGEWREEASGSGGRREEARGSGGEWREESIGGGGGEETTGGGGGGGGGEAAAEGGGEGENLN